MAVNKKSTNKTSVSSEQAAVIHQLLGECFETSLRQQLMNGEFNAAMLGKIADWLKHNNISVTEDAGASLAALAAAFRGDGNGALNYLDSITASEI